MGSSALQEQLLSIIQGFSKRKLTVVGDAVADQFVYGVISRVSREAPVFILRHEQTETIPGGAANCAINLASLGASVSLISVIGNDETGLILRDRLTKSGVDCEGVVISEKLKTVRKLRVLAGQVHSPRQQVIRIDYENEPAADENLSAAILAHAKTKTAMSDAVIISDYNYGVASAEVTAAIREGVKQSTPIVVDSRSRLTSFGGCTSATPNEEEVDQLLGRISNDERDLAIAAEQLRQKLSFQALLVTRGSHGMLLLEQQAAPLSLEAVGASDPVDVTGAGDTVIATYALAVASGASYADAARLANYAAGLVVMKRGTASVNPEELANWIRQANNV